MACKKEKLYKIEAIIIKILKIMRNKKDIILK